jgi:Domain of Unknown Function (DUF1080)
MKLSAILLFVYLFSGSIAATEWKPLFNGKNLDGWQTYVSYQPESNDYNHQSTQTPRGINSDPRKVFTVADGSLRISGEEWGGITSEESFSNFHLRFEIKWGEKKWHPRLDARRDSGILYFAVGPQGAQSQHWMRSHEFQIQEGDCGDYHSLDGVTVDANVGNANEGDWKFFRYDPSLPLKTGIASRILKLGTLEKINYEKPFGEWNLMEVIANKGTIIHKVNGKEVLRLFNSQQKIDGKYQPLNAGKIQIQSEGAEVFYRNIEIKNL